MTHSEPDLEAAYALETPEDNKRLYADWAETYDSSFAEDMDYRLAAQVGQIFEEVGGTATPVLDVGAGTGLVVRDITLRPGVEVDALDLSAEMLEVAARLGKYRAFLRCDLTKALPIETATYGAILSAGTFTHGHVGPDALDELLRIAKPGAVFVLSVNAEHFSSRGFEAKFAGLEPQIRDLDLRTIDIYGAAAESEHKRDQAKVAVFRKR
ncbi:hypothetical protein AB838_12805 [Rhodobacteraceae bacterium (ex Bugula neritina AB1)]|nr:hypothetical protein AB838_12805 [Rhodobacteraceae bacterium (ex Bugula neritina AB1)]